ncbi:hypothetical protein SKAU_G00181800 [Synaphobranchus kaupii]|uniref:tRNA (uracil(54)-C(5))-methyltransferase n=1 Tax=Synaphobranchus kaupii TaxID=118154 RepID=A0A9Q1FN18_SYNKA|nr:hypothetical protein SKAU_G00181800 [Synaphobranchus kaupii]
MVFRCKQNFRAVPRKADLSSSVKDVIASKDLKHSIGALAQKGKRRKHRKPQRGEAVSWEERLADVVTPLWRLSYEQQLQLKQERQEDIVRCLSDAGAYRCPPVLPIRPSPVTDGYRNKSTFSVNVGPGGDPKTVGFYVGTGKERNIVCVGGDHLRNVPEKHKLVARCYEEFLRLSPLDPCLLFHKGGHWREITVRTNSAGHTMAIVFFHPQTMALDEVQLHKAALLEYFTQGPGADCQLDSLYFQESSMTRCSHQQAPFQLLYGASHIYEDLLGLRFRISPDAFFQVNTAGAEVLYNSIRELCALEDGGKAVGELSALGNVGEAVGELSALGNVGEAVGELSDISEAGLGGATLLDVCCGAGVIGISMASAVSRVIGVEIVEQAVEDARYNATLNHAWNCSFLPGKAEEVLPSLLPSLSSQHGLVVVANPSRAGLHYRTVRALRNLPSIRRLVYVSCKPEGEATRNFLELCCPADPRKKLTGEPFTLKATVPVDMFPHTLHSAVCFFISALGITAGAIDCGATALTRPPCLCESSSLLPIHGFSERYLRVGSGTTESITKFSETDADPHNAVRGFFFSHIGWLLVRKHPDVIEKGGKLELADLRADKVVMFQRNVAVMFRNPDAGALVPVGGVFMVAYFVPCLLRYTIVLNATWLVNSAGPYVGETDPTTSTSTHERTREGFHNYHHTFPFDYSTSELGAEMMAANDVGDVKESAMHQPLLSPDDPLT